MSARGSKRLPVVRGFSVSVPHRLRAERDEPRERVVEPLPHEPLERLVAAGTVGAEVVPLVVAPDDAAREEHRAAGAHALLDDDRVEAELARADGGDEARHPAPAIEHRFAGPGPARPWPQVKVGAWHRSTSKRERRLVLDVLDADVLGAAQEDGVRVRRVDDVVDLDADVLRGGDRLVRRVDEHREMVEQRPLRRTGLARMELDPRTADRDARARPTGRARPARSRRTGTRPPSPPGSPNRARRGRGRTRRPSAPRRARDARPRRDRASRSPPSRLDTRRATCFSAPCSRGPSAAKSVSLPRRASEPTSVNLSVRSMTCMPSRVVTNSAMGSRSATQ